MMLRFLFSWSRSSVVILVISSCMACLISSSSDIPLSFQDAFVPTCNWLLAEILMPILCQSVLAYLPFATFFCPSVLSCLHWLCLRVSFQYFHISPLAVQLSESGCGYCMKLNTTIVVVVNLQSALRAEYQSCWCHTCRHFKVNRKCNQSMWNVNEK